MILIECIYNFGKSINRNLFNNFKLNPSFPLKTKNLCSDNCFMNNLIKNQNNINSSYISYKLNNLEDIMFKKVFKIFKFDPFSIYKCLLIFNKNNKKNRKPKKRVSSEFYDKFAKDNDNYSNITCLSVFIRLLEIKYNEEMKDCLYFKYPSLALKSLKKPKSTNQIIHRIHKQIKNSRKLFIL